MARIDCCHAWHYCCVEGKCVKPETLDSYTCTTAKHLSRGVNHLKRGELLLVDGNSLLHRSFHALPFMSSPAGLPTNAVYGTLKALEKLVGEFSPTHLAVCFDASKQTFRHKLYPQYKANRKPAPQDMAKQFSLIREVLSALNIPYFEHPEYEADDLLGTIASKAAGFLTRIATGDRDCIQLVNPRVRLVLYKNGGHVEMDEQAVRDEYGIEPWQVAHYKALAGDKSDNIPGVPGIGEKTALELVRQYGTVGQISQMVESIPGRAGKLLAEGTESTTLSYELAKINCSCPVEVNFDSLKLDVDVETGRRKLADLGIKKVNFDVLAGKSEMQPEAVREKSEKVIQKPERQKAGQNPEVEQLSLF